LKVLDDGNIPWPTGLIARIVCDCMKGPEPTSLFTAALFHGIGKAVLSQFVEQFGLNAKDLQQIVVAFYDAYQQMQEMLEMV